MFGQILTKQNKRSILGYNEQSKQKRNPYHGVGAPYVIGTFLKTNINTRFKAECLNFVTTAETLQDYYT